MRHKTFSLVLACLIAVPMMFADNSETEIEIQLFEVAESSFIGGDNPLGNPNHGGITPTQPTDFHATISGNILSVTANNANSTLIIVRNVADDILINTTFYGCNVEQLSASGAYTIEIQNGDMTLIGQFYVQ